jgi:hypothetical protein
MPLLSTYASATGRSYGARLDSPVPTYSLAASGGATSVNEGNTITYVLVGSFITDDTYYWTINHVSTVDADFSSVSGSFGVASDTGSFTITTTSDLTTEGAQTFTVSVRRGSISGTVVATSSPATTVNDTSLTPSISISPALGGQTTINTSSGSTVATTSCGTWTFTPSSTFTAYVKIWGGGGGGAQGALNITSSGGGAGYTAGYVTFYSGTSYRFIVGCAGATTNAIRYGGGGGGGTALLLTTGLVPIMIAGGGGGSGWRTGTAQGGVGGGGQLNGGSAGGGGGTQSAAGAGGAGNPTAPTYAGSSGSGNNGGPGGYGANVVGGGGGYGSGGNSGSENAGGGGGGGGGYWGGGGGGNTFGGGGGSGWYDLTYCYSVDAESGSGRTPGKSADADRGTAGNGAYGIYAPGSGNPGSGTIVTYSADGKFTMTIV